MTARARVTCWTPSARVKSFWLIGPTTVTLFGDFDGPWRLGQRQAYATKVQHSRLQPVPLSLPQPANSIAYNYCSRRSKWWRSSGIPCLTLNAPLRRRRWCSTSRASGLNSPLSCGWRGCSDISTTGDKLRLMRAWLQRLGRANRSIGNGAYRRPAIPDYEQHCSSSPGSGFVISQSQRSATGSRNGSRAAAAILKKQRLAMARKLLVPLWKYVTAGVVIDRVVMKTA
jgi:hypothetical protein